MPESFSNMYHFVRRLTEHIKTLMALPLELREAPLNLLFPDLDIATVADTLIETIPVTHSDIKYASKSYEKVRLIQLNEEIKGLGNLLREIRFSISVPQKELENLEFWNFECKKKDTLSTKPWTYHYIDLIVDELGKVRFIPKIKLHACDLTSDSRKVYMNLRFIGPFESIEYLSVPGIERQLWSVTCNSQDSTLRLNVMRYFLFLQVVVAWGKNELVPIKVEQDGIFTTSIQIQIANSQEPSREIPLSEIAWQSVSNYVLQQSYPRYIEVSKEFEMKLSEELVRRQMYVQQGVLEDKYVSQIKDWIATLEKFRQAYLEEISEVK